MAICQDQEWMIVRGRSDVSERVKEGGKSVVEIRSTREKVAVRTRLMEKDYHNLIGAPVVIKDTTSSSSCAHNNFSTEKVDGVNLANSRSVERRSVESPVNASGDQLNFENGEWPSMSTDCISPPQLGSWSTAVKKPVNKEGKRQVLRISFIYNKEVVPFTD